MNGFDSFLNQSNNPNQSKLNPAQWKEFQEFKDEYIKGDRIRRILLQDINDTLEGRILPNNIHRDAILTRHIKTEQVTADKILFAETNGLGSLALEDGLAYGDITGTKPPENADVTLSAIQGELSLAGGGLVLASAGAKIRGGQTAYATGTGFWLGDVSGVSKFSIGSSTKYMKWDGTALNIKGLVSLDALSVLNADLGTITAGNITLDSSGFIRTAGKTSYADTTAGFWLGYEAGNYKFTLGNASNWVKWTGTGLAIKGRLSVGGGTNEDIYFEDSAVRMYDAVSGGDKQVYFKYSTLNFARLTYHSTDSPVETDFRLYAGAYALFMGQKANGVAGFITTGTQIVIGTGSALSSLMFWTGTRQLNLGVSVNAPTSNNYAGQIIIKEGGAQNALHLYTTAWRAIQSTEAW